LLALNTPSELKHRHGTSSLIEIDLKGVEPERLDQALAAIDELNPNARLSDEIIVIDVDEGQELMRPIRTVLGRLAIEPREIRFRRRSLEDVFIEITGRRLRE
jgi:ABC-2 type transport system ATP-binding protein